MGCGRGDVLVQMKEVVRVELRFDLLQPSERLFAVRSLDPILAFGAQVVHVATTDRPRPKALPRTPAPIPVRIGFLSLRVP